MSDKEDGDQLPEKPFYVDRAKTGRAGCKKCKQKIAQGELRFAKIGHNPFGSGTMKQWHHIPCIFEVFKKQRATTKKIESPDDIGGWEELNQNDKQEIMSNFDPELKKVFESSGKINTTPNKTTSSSSTTLKSDVDKNHKDNSFRVFRKLCVDLSNDSSYLTKTKIISDFFNKGTDGDFFKGDIELWCKLLLPGAEVRVYNLQNKQLIKLFSRILETNHEEMLEDLEKGDVAETICKFFEKSKAVKPSNKSSITLQDVDEFLEKLSKMTKEDEQCNHFIKITKKSTSNDLKMILRLIKHDLRINAGPKHILEAIHKDAYKAFQTCRDLKTVVANALKAKEKSKNKKEGKESKDMAISISMMTPALPMLAQACKSIEMALKKCPNGMFSEIKYDGERVQVHKQGNTFKYFSRSLKPVLSHKVDHFKDYIPQAFPHGKDLILDAEIIMVDNATGKPLPFGSLGIHKKTEFKNANVCLFVFDCLFYNGESLLNRSIKERKKILNKNIVEVKNRIMLSEMEEIHKAEDLEKMIAKVFKQGLEGLVLKDLNSNYEPGKRHWLKVKKDYLFDGAIADTADLVVLGAWFGTGSKGGIMSSFLMGCFDPKTKKWVTVTKVSGGHDDSTLEKLQKELKVVKISKDQSKVPKWLNCTKTMIPDFVASDPEKMPVWEITGAEFTCNQIHTANGISIRFPRVTKIRDDKDWTTATNLDELKELYKNSKQMTDFNLKKLTKADSEDSDDEESIKEEKRKKGPPSKKAKTEEDLRVYEEDTEDEESIKGEKRKKATLELRQSKKAKTEEDMIYEEDTESEDSIKGEKQKKDAVGLGQSKNAKTEDDMIYEEDTESEKSIKGEKRKKGTVKLGQSKKAKTEEDLRIYEEDTEDEDSIKGEKQKKATVELGESNKEDTDSDTEVETDNAQTHEKFTDLNIENPLHDIFTNCVIQIPKNYNNYNLLRRYIIAYDGVLHDKEKNNSLENSKKKVTHVVHLNNKTVLKKENIWAENVRHVHVNWVWDSIKLLEKQSEGRYVITAKGNK